MLNNLFSLFDPCTGMMSLNWLSSFIFMYMFPMKFWLMNGKINLMIEKLIIKLNMEMKMLTLNSELNLIFMSIFLLILINNLMGLIPYIFTSSSHLVFSLTLSLPMWMGFMIFGWMNKTNKMFSHMVPIGTPMMLAPFMVMIETVSNLIRPGALSVRLTANMIAGHLLMSLLGSKVIDNSFLMIMVMILMLFEAAVSIIQSYVFTTLSALYSSEV